MMKHLVLLALLLPLSVFAVNPVEVDISRLKPGQLMLVKRADGPIWILFRTKEMIASISTTNDLVRKEHYGDTLRQPKNMDPSYRSYKKEYFVVVGRCYDNISTDDSLPIYPYLMTGLDNVFTSNVGFYCQGTGAAYDFAGRVFNNYFGVGVENMKVPEYYFKNDTTIVLGKNVR